MSDVGCWMSDVGCWMLDVGCLFSHAPVMLSDNFCDANTLFENDMKKVNFVFIGGLWQDSRSTP